MCTSGPQPCLPEHLLRLHLACIAGLLSGHDIVSSAGMVVRPGNGAEQTLVREAPTIPELYTRTVASDPGSTFDQASFIPQVRLLPLAVLLHPTGQAASACCPPSSHRSGCIRLLSGPKELASSS